MTVRQNRVAMTTGCGCGRRRMLRSALTLTELLVAIAVLSIMILLGASMMAATQRSIKLAQASARYNADARAVADRLRHDMLAASQNGIMVIMMGEDNLPHLVFLTVGTYHSLCDAGALANVARIDYGVGVIKDESGQPHNVFYRRAILQNPTDLAAYQNDHERRSLSYYYLSPLTPVHGLKDWFYSSYMSIYSNIDPSKPLQPDGLMAFPYIVNPPWKKNATMIPPITLPVSDVADLAGLWPYMLSDVVDMDIQWTDGTVKDGRLQWYGKGNPKDPEWATKGTFSRYWSLWNGRPYTVEHNVRDIMGAAGDRYCAFWAFEKKEHWPRAIRLKFKIGNPVRAYDVIVDLPDMHQGS